MEKEDDTVPSQTAKNALQSIVQTFPCNLSEAERNAPQSAKKAPPAVTEEAISNQDDQANEDIVQFTEEEIRPVSVKNKTFVKVFRLDGRLARMRTHESGKESFTY